tara:strand:+ start:814 stop:1461 length:648 start_codon:yes stop_codon:yes gene_type:complete
MLHIFINGETGKMGSSIAKLIELNDNFTKVKKHDFKISDVVIDFSHPDSTSQILKNCLKERKPLVIGTTGLEKSHMNKIEKASKTIPILIGSNMSKGVIDLKETLKYYLNNNSELIDCVIEETHHTEKIDSPSGTALELKDHIISLNNKNIKSIEIVSNRVGDVFGIHKVVFIKKNSIKEFKHEALSRDVFAYGALYAAKKIHGLNPAIYRFQDI